ncbi:hypothetical protein E1180_13240 [Roseibium denhamense]|uniref:Glucosamine kinase n=1 Tax=Roseibium denhamense TaxID=76305 RepID=A0ABY1NHW6_9HYPH|nr:hypothetical protein [Roseibium denhamense]MTI06483.1 hypothetical protein [Roseibium denhamense]SMP09468.1 glucosamine kinase [Roseibium denhamense]
MSAANNSSRLAIEVSGSSSRFALQTPDRRFDHEADGADFRRGLFLTVDRIRRGLKALSEKSGLLEARLQGVPTYIALAGVRNMEIADAIKSALPFSNVVIEDERRSAVIGALGENDGSLAGVGIESFAARQINKEVRLLGGYGHVLGAEASACWLGQQLLRRMLQSEDGFVSATPLILDSWDVFDGDLAKLLEFSGSAGPIDFAALAPRVIDAAAQDDANAKYILRLGATYIKRCFETLQHRQGDPVCLIDSIAPVYLPYLPETITRDLTDAKGTAIDGALELAALLSVTQTDEWKSVAS